ncbi:TerB family tellurite resistance protein [Reinekea sp.]|jgi:uncharacterized tellurite resistance protein B-like protein|uniref:TerB family tellurite resistance protein n=1 Tax=Reinekea sp. TaxID=1970455 RepID=UPI002A804DC2|nr:TerB family tellurite resistance protein [Reinekea sp.]
MLAKLLELLNGPNGAVDQQKSEAIIALTTLLYQADGKVKLTEQDLFARLLEDLPWQNPGISKAAHHQALIADSLQALNGNHLTDYLAPLVPALKSDARVLTLLRELAVTDGSLDVKEAEILRLVSSMMVSEPG